MVNTMSDNSKKNLKKKLLIILAAIVVLFIIVIVGINSLLSSDSFKGKITAMVAENVKTYTGLDLKINGPFEVNIFPSIGISVNEVSLAGSPGSKLAIPLQSLELKEAILDVGLFSVIGGNPQINVVDLRGLTATLVGLGDEKLDMLLNFEQVVLSDFSATSGGTIKMLGAISWPENLVNIDLNLLAKLLDSQRLLLDIKNTAISGSLAGLPPIDVSGSGKLEVASAVDLQNIKELAHIKQINCQQFKLGVAGLNITAEGQVNPNNLVGEFKLAIAGDPAALLAIAGYQAASEKAARNLDVAVSIKGDEDLVSISELNAKLDDISLTSSGHLSQGRQLALNGQLELNTLNVDNYMPKAQSNTPAAQNRSPQRSSTPSSATAPAASSSAFNPLGLLLGANLNLEVSGKQVSFAGQQLSNLKTTIKGQDRRFEAKPLTANFHDGLLNLNLLADMRGQDSKLAINGGLTNLSLANVTPLVNGKLNKVDLDLTMVANDKVLNTLNGKANFALGGISEFMLNLPAPLNGLSKGVTVDNASGSFNIRNGVASTSSLLAKGNLFEGKGSGTINLPSQQLNLQLTVKAGGISIKGINEIPLNVTGPISSPSISIDAARLAKEAVTGQLLENLPGNAQGLDNLLRQIPGRR